MAYPFIFTFVGALFTAAVASAWVSGGAVAWLAGFIYIVYDSCILVLIARSGRAGISRAEPPTGPLPSVAVLIAARNERDALPACLAALRAQSVQPDEVMVVDDGSTDGSVAALDAQWSLTFAGDLGTSAAWPRLRVLRKPHSGKARSLNEGLGLVESAVLITLDADTLLEPSAVAAVAGAFARDPLLAAAGGVLSPRCASTAWGRFLEFHQTFEYLRGFVGRLAWARRDVLLLVSGAFSAFRLDVLTELGGFDPESLVEDYDLIHRLHRRALESGRRLRVGVLGDARARTDAPGSPAAFLAQRTRWFAGFLQTLARNRDMVGSPRYAPVGTVMLPVKAMDTLQPLYGLYGFATLAFWAATRHPIAQLIVQVLVAKFAFDLAFHFYILALYRRWVGAPLGARFWIGSLAATLTEPFVFQNLRHLGAALGWVAFLRRRIRWTPPDARAVHRGEIPRAR
ncbi:MAG TPA: glycosyltransferase [Myxococcaceae bacterium]|nr:glycosyltransferase [Myxococcaceae bacterium]